MNFVALKRPSRPRRSLCSQGTLVVLLAIICLGVGARADSDFFDQAIGKCPRGWKEAASLCYKFVDKKFTFSRALRHCHKLRSRHFEDKSDFTEDISTMLTAQDLHTMIRNGHDIYNHIWKPIWLNGVKLDGTIYSVHRIPFYRRFKEIDPDDHDFGLQEIFPPEDSVLFPESEDFDSSTVMDNQALFLFNGWDTRNKTLTTKYYLEEDGHYFVCTHKRERRNHFACPGHVTECNNNGRCINGNCECYPEAQLSEGTCIVPPPTTTTLTPSAPSCDEPGLYVAMDPVAASPQPLIGCSFLCGGTPACTHYFVYGNDPAVPAACELRTYVATVLYPFPGHMTGLFSPPPVPATNQIDQMYVGAVSTAADVEACQQACVDDPGTGTQECMSITFNNAAATDNCIFNFFTTLTIVNDATTANFVSAPPTCPPA